MSKVNITRIICYLLLVFWMLVIFVMSAQPAYESSQISGGIVSKIIAAFLHNFDSLSAENQENITHIVTIIVRKTAHFLEFFVLGALAFLSALMHKKYIFKIKIVSSFIFCLLYAISDEIHQLFVQGRACRIGDVCIDAAGSLVAIMLLGLIVYFKKRR